MILQISLGGLNVTGKFIIVGIQEALIHICLTGSPVVPTAGLPLVPACDKYNLRIDLQSVIPLLGEVVAPLGGLGPFYLVAILIGDGVGTAAYVTAAHTGHLIHHVVVI